MDEGLPVAYPVLERGVPVMSSDGEQIGTVHHVVAAPEEDIFHGLVISVTAGGRRFVEARGLPEPGGAAPVFDEDPATINTWTHWAHRLTGRKDWHRRS